MGLLKHLLFWPVTGPSFLTRFSLEKANEAARTELTDDTAVKQELMELQMQLELGEIEEEEYVEREAVLMERLREVRRWREEFGMPTAGGLVRVADDGGAGEAEGGEASRAEPPPTASGEGAEIDVALDFDDDPSQR